MPELIPAEPGTAEWLAARATGVTATDIPAILGISPWESAYSVFWRKLGQIPEVEDNDRMRLGRQLEVYVLCRWGEANPDAAFSLNGPELWRHPDRPWQMATTDSTVFDSRGVTTAAEAMEGAAVVGVLEVKTSGTKDGWGADGSAEIPPHVRAQVLWQMDVMGVATGHVGVVFLPSGEFRSYVIEHKYPASLCDVCADQELMLAAGETFMAQLRHEIPPPDPDASEASLAAVRARFAKAPGKEVEVSLSLWNAWYGAKQEAATWADLVRKYEIQLREQAGEASVYTVDGQPVARRIIVDAQVQAHTRHSDYLRRITPREDET